MFSYKNLQNYYVLLHDAITVINFTTYVVLQYGTRHIIETLLESGYTEIKSLLICGGLSRNPLFVQTQADVVGLPIIQPNEEESVLLGSAILGACAAGYFENMSTAIKTMAGSGTVIIPNSDIREYHNRKYRVFLKMLEHQKEYKTLMLS